MTAAEREAMTLERELRAHVAGMQCAIDNCGVSAEEWQASAQYAMDHIGEWKRLLSGYAGHLSRTAEPVAYASAADLEKLRGLGSGFETIPLWGQRGRDIADTPLFVHPSEDGRDKKDAARYRWLRENGEQMITRDRGCGPGYTYCDELDAAIDAAMAQERTNGR